MDIKKNILKIAVWTIVLLLIPLAIQLTIGTGVDGQGWNWTLGDFVFAGIIIFVAGLLIDLAMRKMGKYKIVGVAGIVLLFVWLWVELAVGLFTNWGN